MALEVLGVPLDAEVEAVGGILHRLDDAVVAAGRHEQPRCQPVDGLMVHGVHRQQARATEGAGQKAALGDGDAAGGALVGRLLAVPHGGDAAGVQVAVQGAPQGRVHDLHTAADAQGGQAALAGAAGQGQLEGIAVLIHAHQVIARIGIGGLIIGPGVDVAAPADDEAVHGRQGLFGQSLVCRDAPGHGRQQHGQRPGGRHALDVLHVHTLEAVGFVQRGGDADDHRYCSLYLLPGR